MTPLQRLIAIRTGGEVERCHSVRHQGSYRVDSHTWGVLVLLYVLWPGDFGRLSPCVLFHDVPEAWVGDIPAPVKRYNGAVKEAIFKMEGRIMKMLRLPWDEELVAEDRAKIKACDQLELYLWACEQVHGGNAHAACCKRELETFFAETPPPGPAYQLFLEINNGGSVEHATDSLIREINYGLR